MIKTKIILPLLLLPLMLISCNKGDDLREIFLSHSWSLAFIQEGHKENPEISSPAKNSAYTLKFYDDTFAFTTKNGTTITGYWQADNKERTFRCSQVRVSSGSVAGDRIAMKADSIFRNARDYEGDSNYLKIMIQENHFMQFHNK
jgi:hypothetical protein